MRGTAKVSAPVPLFDLNLLSVTSSTQSESADLQSIVMRYTKGRLLLRCISYCDIYKASLRAGYLIDEVCRSRAPLPQEGAARASQSSAYRNGKMRVRCVNTICRIAWTSPRSVTQAH